MKTINYQVACSTEYNLEGYLSKYFDKEKLLFFDIETTGFIAKNSTLYLIGVLWCKDDMLYLRQWFNDDGQSEADLITSFVDFCNDYSHLVHFNGMGFDLPYLRQKAEQLSLSFDIEQTMFHIDIYKEIRSYKNIFALDNMKQVSIEHFLNLHREDTYTGKDLIHIYQRYIAKPDATAEHLLLLHNHDDVLGMTSVSKILHYKYFFEQLRIKDITMDTTDEQLVLRFSFDEDIPLMKRIISSKNKLSLNVLDNVGTLQIPICKNTLKHFFDDYKNYYYLPLEDMAIHKSVATYVENQNKIKATKQTCYIKRKDLFIPNPITNIKEVFKVSFSDKCSYILLSDFENYDFKSQCEYIKNTLLTFL